MDEKCFAVNGKAELYNYHYMQRFHVVNAGYPEEHIEQTWSDPGKWRPGYHSGVGFVDMVDTYHIALIVNAYR